MTVRREGQGPPHKGPPLAVLAIVHAVLFIASIVVLNGVTDGSWPLPGVEPDLLVEFLTANRGLVQVAGMLQFASAVPLALYAATGSHRLEHLGVRAAGTRIGSVGGSAAAVLLALSGLLLVTVAASAGTRAGAALVALHHLIFVSGGVGQVVFLGLLVAGMAVPSLVAGFAPRWLCWTSLAIAAAAELATLALVLEPVQVLLPIGRFGGMAALIGFGVLLPTKRRGSPHPPA